MNYKKYTIANKNDNKYYKITKLVEQVKIFIPFEIEILLNKLYFIIFIFFVLGVFLI